jgi:ABC-type multidrug transport system permease subunit
MGTPSFAAVLLALARRTWRKTFERPVHLAFGFVQPLIWLLFFGFLFQRYSLVDLDPGLTYLDFLVPGVCAMTVLFGASQSGIGWIRDHQTGFLERMLQTPAPPLAILGGKIFADVARLLVQAALVALLALALARASTSRRSSSSPPSSLSPSSPRLSPPSRTPSPSPCALPSRWRPTCTS